MTYHHPHLPTTPITVIHCSRDGSSSVSPGAGGNCRSLTHHEPTTPCATSSGMGPWHSAATDNDMVLSLLSAPVLKEAPNYGSSQTQGLLVNGTMGDSRSTHTHLIRGLWPLDYGYGYAHKYGLPVWVPASGFIVASLACVLLVFDQSGSLAHNLLGRMRCSW